MGRPIRRIATTQSRRAGHEVDAALRAAEQRYASLIESAHDIIIVLAPDGRITLANPAFERILGWSRREWVGKHVGPLFVAADRPRADQAIALTLAGETVTGDIRVRSRSGEVIVVQYDTSAELLDDGAVAVRLIARDVTGRRAAERQLAARATQQEAVVRLGSAALAGRALDQLFDDAVTLVAETLHTQEAAVYELLPGGEELGIRAAVGALREQVGTGTIPAALRSQPGYTLLSRGPVTVSDFWVEDRFSSGRSARNPQSMRSGLSVIIGDQRLPFGVLGAECVVPRSYSADDVTFLQTVANVLALAVQRHRADVTQRQLLARLITAQEEERHRVSRDLHDQAGQTLSALLVGLRAVDDAPSLEDVRPLVQRLRELAGEATRDVGRIARGLRPSVLDDLGLVAAIERLAEDVHAAGGPTVRFRGALTERLAPAIETTLYRIVQEAITNVLRHARATTATVALTLAAASIRITVQDDGIGFDVAASLANARRTALGLAGMRERAALAGGTVTLDSEPGTGTTVTVELPREGR
jgi:PAS domain S-box-containing protein